jgi:hypothetical protein
VIGAPAKRKAFAPAGSRRVPLPRAQVSWPSAKAMRLIVRASGLNQVPAKACRFSLAAAAGPDSSGGAVAAAVEGAGPGRARAAASTAIW